MILAHLTAVKAVIHIATEEAARRDIFIERIIKNSSRTGDSISTTEG